MPDRFLVTEVVELGVETTPGVAVPSTVRLGGLVVEIDTALELDRIAPSGNLFDTIAAPRQEWATGSLSGYPTYTELPYVFSNVFGAATITTPSGAVNARRWHWAPSSATPWTPKTWTIRRGMVGNTAEMASYGLMTGVGMSFSRTAQPEISGDLFAQALDYAASVVGSGLLQLDLVPILPGEVCVYVDPTFAAIGTTRLTRDFLASFEIGGLFGPFWPLDCTLDSFGGHAPLKPDSTMATLQLGNDTQGRELVGPMRTGDTRYLRIEATGPQIDAGPPIYNHRLRIDAALKVVEAPTRADADGLSTLEWGFGLFDDPDFGGALAITLDTTTATL
jgi:hypothetical protein